MNDLLTDKDIAAMHHCEVRHVRRVIVKLPGFPPPAPTSTERKKLWVAREVRDYITRKSRKPS